MNAHRGDRRGRDTGPAGCTPRANRGHHQAAACGDLIKWLSLASQPLDCSGINEALRLSRYSGRATRGFGRSPSHMCPASQQGTSRPYRARPRLVGCRATRRARSTCCCRRCTRQRSAARSRHVPTTGTFLSTTQLKRRGHATAALRVRARVLPLVGGETRRQGADVFVKREGRIELLDLSRAPTFTLDARAAGELLRVSPDKGVCDTMTTHGVVFGSPTSCCSSS